MEGEVSKSQGSLFPEEKEPPKAHKTTSPQNRSRAKKKRATRSQERNDAADIIYQAYPKHVAKAAALAAIRKALTKCEFSELLAAVQDYAGSQDGREPRYIAHPATWFNAERWTDDRSVWSEWKASANGRCGLSGVEAWGRVRKALAVWHRYDAAERQRAREMLGETLQEFMEAITGGFLAMKDADDRQMSQWGVTFIREWEKR